MSNAGYVTWVPGQQDLQKIANHNPAFHEMLMEHLTRYVPRGGRVFDYGAGACKFLGVAKRRGYQVAGLNPCKHMAEWARTIDIPVAPVFGADYQVTQQYDLLVSEQTFEHLIEPRRDFMKVREIVKPGGYAYIEVPNWNSIRRLWRGLDCLRVSNHYNYFSPYTLSRMAKECGFEIVEQSIPASTSMTRAAVKRALGWFGIAGGCSIIARRRE